MQAKVGWFKSTVIFMHIGLLSIATGFVVDATVTEVDRVTDRKTCYSRAHGIDDFGTITTQNRGKFVGVVDWLDAQLGV
ncbi:MAG: hypothetical protein DID92_2727745488 [Candidatus Nitrotoga sp. SPKER]|nr:MAG: hypothetical protein DID92_2727745488 [Candidatus Nitrotoga sp. SPKER]